MSNIAITNGSRVLPRSGGPVGTVACVYADGTAKVVWQGRRWVTQTVPVTDLMIYVPGQLFDDYDRS